MAAAIRKAQSAVNRPMKPVKRRSPESVSVSAYGPRIASHSAPAVRPRRNGPVIRRRTFRKIHPMMQMPSVFERLGQMREEATAMLGHSVMRLDGQRTIASGQGIVTENQQ